MKKSLFSLFGLLTFVALALSHAQPVTAPVYDLNPTHLRPTLPAGTITMLQTTDVLDADSLTVGAILSLEVMMDVRVEGKTLVAKGAFALGRVASKTRHTTNNPGTLTLDIMAVQAVDGQMVRVKALDQLFAGKRAGSPVYLPKGTRLVAFVQSDTEVVFPEETAAKD